jgi:hypothetical protein
MQYTKGIRGPESTNVAKVEHHSVSGPDANPLVKGTMTMNLKKGPRLVSFMAQGKHARAFLDIVKESPTIVATVRWTARESVTVTGVRQREDLIKKYDSLPEETA